MIRWICSVKPHDKIPMETLYTKLRIQEVAVALRTKRLRWYGHAACYGVHLHGQIQLPVSPSLILSPSLTLEAWETKAVLE